MQESRSREEQYRSQMSELLEQNRLLRADSIESQRQAATSQSLAQQLRQAARESDAGEISRGAALQIADDEIRMLEHELKRLSLVNQSLNHHVSKYENIIYGSSLRRSGASSAEMAAATNRPSNSTNGLHISINASSSGGSRKGRKSTNKVQPLRNTAAASSSDRNAISTNRSRSTSPSSSSTAAAVARNIFNSSSSSNSNKLNTSHTNVSFGRGGGYYNSNNNGELDAHHQSSSQQQQQEQEPRYQWRDGCLRSPLRCPASSLLLLPADDYEILDLHHHHHRHPRHHSSNNHHNNAPTLTTSDSFHQLLMHESFPPPRDRQG